MRISDWSSDVCSSDLKYGSPACAPSSGTALTDNILLVREEEPSTLPGLRFALPPASPGELSAVQWDWTCDPSVLAVTALPARKGFDLRDLRLPAVVMRGRNAEHVLIADGPVRLRLAVLDGRSEEHTSELQSLMRISYAVFC